MSSAAARPVIRTPDQRQGRAGAPAGQPQAEALQLVAAVERQLQHADLRRSFERGLARTVGRRGW